MRLAELVADCDVRVRGDLNLTIGGLAYDSRQVKPGDLFFSTARDPQAARNHIQQALDRGARAVVVKTGDGGDARSAATVIECEWPRRLMGTVASRFFGKPSRRLDLIGITGTSGKTTTTYLMKSIWGAAGYNAGMIGTIGIFAGDHKLYSGLTTPESIEFEAGLKTMADDGVRAVAAEISSIGLAEHRVDELSFRAALFTNLSRDHLDYHSTTEAYFEAKLRLFSELLPKSQAEPVAIVNGDDSYGQRVLDAVPGRKLSFGIGCQNHVRAVNARYSADGITATIVTPTGSFAIESPLLGEINLRNILGASALSVALGIDADVVAAGVRRCLGAPGRLEAVTGPPGVKVLVDYAHKPDALAAVLETLRALQPRRLICVFGCGGDRDRGKRPIMGVFAARLADFTIVTSDNPRTENPLSIIEQIEQGMREGGCRPITQWTQACATGYTVEPDRREAIAIALRIAQRGDIVLIAGKGHEDYQLVGDRRLDFDDRVVVRELTAAMSAE